MVGASRLDMEACAGIPAHTEQIGTATIAEYSYETKGSGLTMALPLLGSLSLSSGGQCTAVWELVGDRVASLRYTAANSGMSGADAPCAALVRGCLDMVRGR